MSGIRVFGTLPTLMAFCASSLITGCGPEPESGTPSLNDQALGSRVESSFSLSYRIYRTRSGVVKKFDDLIPTSWFKDIERRDEEDYYFDFFPSLGTAPGGIALSLLKWPTRNEDDVYVEMNFRMPAAFLETDKVFECPFGSSIPAGDCAVSGDITSLGRRERLFLPSNIKSPPLLCRFKISESTLTITSDGLAGRSLRFPPNPGSPESAEKLAFGFRCEDTKNHLLALKGYFLQNTRRIPTFTH